MEAAIETNKKPSAIDASVEIVRNFGRKVSKVFEGSKGILSVIKRGALLAALLAIGVTLGIVVGAALAPVAALIGYGMYGLIGAYFGSIAGAVLGTGAMATASVVAGYASIFGAVAGAGASVVLATAYGADIAVDTTNHLVHKNK